jgi:aspartyl-tRNA(Asn)/glutamyl-tRNA(Gln) amidotransferase subunit A
LLPLPAGTYAAFRHEAAGVHRGLFAEQPERYGADVRAKLESCLAVTAEAAAAAARARDAYRERLAEAAAAVDLVVTPALGFVAPAADVDELEVRDAMIERTYPFNAAGWPALALPAGAAEDGLPASLQLAAPPGQDALVLAAGELLERKLRC